MHCEIKMSFLDQVESGRKVEFDSKTKDPASCGSQ